jgi:hypothetical protein
MAAPLREPARDGRIPHATCSEAAGLDQDVGESERACMNKYSGDARPEMKRRQKKNRQQKATRPHIQAQRAPLI